MRAVLPRQYPTTGRRKRLKQVKLFARLHGFLLKQLLAVKRGRGMMAAWADMGRGKPMAGKIASRDAGYERPGAIAIDTDGHVLFAEGGNDYDGAKCWVAMPC